MICHKHLFQHDFAVLKHWVDQFCQLVAVMRNNVLFAIFKKKKKNHTKKHHWSVYQCNCQ